MLFCSEPQLDETCSSCEDNVLVVPPRNPANELLLLDFIIVPKEPRTCTQTTLPPIGSPLSIFEFAGLSSEQQKQWLEACSDVKQNTTQRKSRSKVVLPLTQNHDAKTDETDSITSLSSRSGSGGDSYTSGVQKRSIFAPYWAKTGEKQVVEQQHHVQDQGKTRSTTIQILQEASQKSMIPPPPLHDVADRGCWRDMYHCIPQHQDATSIAVTLPEQPAPLTPKRRAVSTSAISILKKKGDGQQQEQEGGRRRRSSSFSVSFDSKVNVVLVFQDKPPYQTRRIPPWWARWISGTTTGEVVDILTPKVIERCAVAS